MKGSAAQVVVIAFLFLREPLRETLARLAG